MRVSLAFPKSMPSHLLFSLLLAVVAGHAWAATIPIPLLAAPDSGPSSAASRPSLSQLVFRASSALLPSTLAPRAVAAVVSPSAPSWTPPLSTRGRYVVDANGQRFKMRGGNWHGASGTYLGTGDINNPANHHGGELAYQTPLCLDRASIDDIISSFLQLGINTIRLPFSNQMIHTTDPVPDAGLTANPQLKGKTPLEVYDAVVQALTAAGIAVILNNMTIRSLWCCGFDVNARWNEVQTTATWQSDWLLMVSRYKNNSRVVGADLYNEVRRDLLFDPNWGGEGATDWYQASLDVASRIQREANPDILIIIEGINWVGIPTKYTPHYRPTLLPVANLSHALPVQDKLVYSAHFYAYTGPSNTGATSGPFVTDDPLYSDLSPSQLADTVESEAAYVATDPESTQMHYTAPVWISEFGSGGRNDMVPQDRSWWANFVQILITRDLDFAYWPLVGWQENGVGDGWALVAWNSSGGRLSIYDPGDWRLPEWNSLIAASNGTGTGSGPQTANSSRTGPIAPISVWRMLNTDEGDANQSDRLYAGPDWSVGNRKASCPDGLRLIGLSRRETTRGLCTDATFGRSWWNASNGTYTVVTDQTYYNNASIKDWASGFTKFQCPPNSFLIGYSFTSSATSVAALCAHASSDPFPAGIATTTRTVWFNKHDSLSVWHGDWSEGDYKGACDDDEFAVGYAFTTHDITDGVPAALLCKRSGDLSSTSSAAPTTMSPPSSLLTLSIASLAASFALSAVVFGPF